jgi:predicted dehydrogenase
MPDPIRLGFIGTGLIVNSSHWPAVSTLPADFKVVALCNRTSAKAEALAARVAQETGQRPAVYVDYAAMLANEKLDAVSLALPTVMNPQVAEAALAAGCHVIAEKPIAASVEDGERMTGWSKKYGRVLLIAENHRYMETYQHAARLVADSAIGKAVTAQWLLCLYTAPDNPGAQTPWRREPAHPGGFLSDGGVHHMASMRTILGEVVSVEASTGSYRPDLKPADTMVAVMNFASGALASYQVSYAVRGPISPLQVMGTEGMVTVTNDWLELRPNHGDKQRWDEPSPFGGMQAMYADFAQAIRTGRPPRSTPEEGLADLRLIVAMLQSNESGRAVRLANG